METYPRAAVERAMRVQEVILRAIAKKTTWTQAGEILGRCERGPMSFCGRATLPSSIDALR